VYCILHRNIYWFWNREKKIQGQFDTPLTPAGEKQARAWGRRLQTYQWDRILSSDLARAIKTAGLVNNFLKIPAVVDPRLREQDWGHWTGKTLAQIREDAPKILAEQEAAGWEFCPPGGEGRDTVCRRVQAPLEHAAKTWPGETILVVAHEGVIKCLVYRLVEYQKDPGRHQRMRPYFLHWISHDGLALRLERINALEINSR
ncbi:histidine phosphatase family protein, partial [Thermodesulfobacteriota bacterium]